MASTLLDSTSAAFNKSPRTAVSRRLFLQNTTLAVLAAGGTLGWAGPTTALAAEPIQRTGQAFFKLSLAAYSFRNQLSRGWPTPSGKPGTMTLFDFMDFCAEQNLDGTELTSYYFPNPLASNQLLKIKEYAFRLGLGISGTAIGNNFCLAPGTARDAQLHLCRQWIDYAAEMGAPVIRIFAGTAGKNQLSTEAMDLCVQGIEESLRYAEKKGVLLALENHGGITSTSEQLLELVKRVQPSPWFGVNFDSGNFHTEDPYADLEKIAPYAVNAQIKVSVSPHGKGKQPADYKRIIKILQQAGYRGYLALEYEEQEDPRKTIPEHLDRLRKLIAEM